MLTGQCRDGRLPPLRLADPATELGGDFCDSAHPHPRVPWANEPGCGSCRTGDFFSMTILCS
jgi:hypothetical protein